MSFACMFKLANDIGEEIFHLTKYLIDYFSCDITSNRNYNWQLLATISYTVGVQTVLIGSITKISKPIDHVTLLNYSRNQHTHKTYQPSQDDAGTHIHTACTQHTHTCAQTSMHECAQPHTRQATARYIYRHSCTGLACILRDTCTSHTCTVTFMLH